MYSRKMFAGWGDMDFNAHMRNTAMRSLPKVTGFVILPPSVKERT